MHFKKIGIIVSCLTMVAYANNAPLKCHAVDLQIKSGINPIQWQSSASLYGIQKTQDLNPIIEGLSFPKFKCFYKIPVNASAQIGYATSDNMRLFLEFNYLNAHARQPSKTRFSLLPDTGAPVGTLLNFAMSNYHLYDFTVGMQYYSDKLMWDRISFFGGIKAGITAYRAVHFTLSENIPLFTALLELIPAKEHAKIFLNTVSPLAGAEAGCSFTLTERLNMILSFECIGTCGPKSPGFVPLMPNIPIPTTNVLIPQIYTQVRFPINLGLRYSF